MQQNSHKNTNKTCIQSYERTVCKILKNEVGKNLVPERIIGKKDRKMQKEDQLQISSRSENGNMYRKRLWLLRKKGNRSWESLRERMRKRRSSHMGQRSMRGA